MLLAKNKRLANKRLFIVFNYRTSAWRYHNSIDTANHLKKLNFSQL
ncbi:hypothetical protein CSC24_3347 [Escherichia coli]|nr:hypothetical protein CSC24_3347 [Escherichia coli]